jgi:hypothetical protein
LPALWYELVLGIPDQVEYPLELKTSPRVARPAEKVQLTFRISGPKDGSTVKKFEVVHEKLFHMFIASRDLTYFIHEHPEPKPDGTFVDDEIFPKPGMYRILADVYPTGGTAQLISKTVFVAGEPDAPISLEDARLTPDLDCQHGQNSEVELVMDPPQPVAGMKTLMFFHFKPADGMTKWLGALGARAGRKRRSDGYDPRASVHRRWRSEDAVQPDLPARPHLPSLGAIRARGCSEYRGVQCSGVGAELIPSSLRHR